MFEFLYIMAYSKDITTKREKSVLYKFTRHQTLHFVCGIIYYLLKRFCISLCDIVYTEK